MTRDLGEMSCAHGAAGKLHGLSAHTRFVGDPALECDCALPACVSLGPDMGDSGEPRAYLKAHSGGQI